MACVFNKQLLHPRNWLTWFGLGILWLIVQLPYPLLHFIGTSAGRLSRRFLKRREIGRASCRERVYVLV